MSSKDLGIIPFEANLLLNFVSYKYTQEIEEKTIGLVVQTTSAHKTQFTTVYRFVFGFCNMHVRIAGLSLYTNSRSVYSPLVYRVTVHPRLAIHNRHGRFQTTFWTGFKDLEGATRFYKLMEIAHRRVRAYVPEFVRFPCTPISLNTSDDSDSDSGEEMMPFDDDPALELFLDDSDLAKIQEEETQEEETQEEETQEEETQEDQETLEHTWLTMNEEQVLEDPALNLIFTDDLTYDHVDCTSKLQYSDLDFELNESDFEEGVDLSRTVFPFKHAFVDPRHISDPSERIVVPSGYSTHTIVPPEHTVACAARSVI